MEKIESSEISFFRIRKLLRKFVDLVFENRLVAGFADYLGIVPPEDSKTPKN